MDPPRVAAIAGDPGGANALLPVLRRLGEERRVRLECLGYRQAPVLWRQAGLPCHALAEDSGGEGLEDVLDAARPDLLLTATSMNGVQLEVLGTLWARRRGVPSLAVLDFWSNYTARFVAPGSDEPAFPDRVAVMDGQARTGMVGAGMPEERILVTGQPAFEGVREAAGTEARRTRDETRTQLGATPETRLLLFLSQPLAEVLGSGPESPGYLGYTERSVLRSIHRAVRNLRPRGDVRILLRAHPREDPARIQGWMEEFHGDVEWVRGHSARDLALASDLVVGMNTAFLVESCLLGCVTLSVQPGLRLPEALPVVRTSALTAVYDEARIQDELERHLFDDATRQAALERARSIAGPEGATGRAVRAVYDLLERGRRGGVPS